MMYYYGKKDFEGLKRIAESFSHQPEYKLFADYCLLREQGLRKQSLQTLQKFILQAKLQTLDMQVSYCTTLIALKYQNPQISIFPQPLCNYAISVLQQKLQQQAADTEILNGLAYLLTRADYYEQVLRIDENNQFALFELARLYITEVDYQCHHLAQSVFLGDSRQALALLNKVERLLDKLHDQAKRESCQVEFDYYKELIQTWLQYQSELVQISFYQWCESQGKQSLFWTIDA